MNFSPLQVGHIANTIKPVSVDAYSKIAIELFEQSPDLEAVPLEENGEPLGVISRKITENFAISAVYRGYQKDLKNFLIPFRGILESSAFISRVVDENIKIDQGKFPAWFMVRHNQRYFGIISLQHMLEYINTLRFQDMKIAGEIQKKILGKSIVNMDKRFQLLFYNRMAHEIGGDYYRVFKQGDHRYLAACFDVSGKNIAGSMATMTLGACFSTLELFRHQESLEALTTLINSLIKNVCPLGHFVTAVLIHIDFSQGNLVIHNCGFSPVSIFKFREDNKAVYTILEPTLPPLGIEDSLDLKEGQALSISSGLRISTYSDGLTDMYNSTGERFGEERTNEFLKAMHTHSHAEMKQLLDQEIRQWIGEASLADDLTLMDLRFT
ncbi:MAG: SpoIIE family protein phosphatase [Spirochaetaceae bacterium]|jgi:sigma-B regulation protein RsbU (phosphoserine phosphatase)|nr:SpoIIE family protein phosphatase [Spirochaetaceae bacterium]